MAKKNKMKPRELREAQKKARQFKAAEINNNAAPAIVPCLLQRSLHLWQRRKNPP